MALAWVVFCLVRWRCESPRCQRCGYDLSGTAEGGTGPICPECATPVPSGRVRYRTRRRWRLALLAAVPLVPASQMVCFAQRPDQGLTRWLPTSVMVRLAGAFDFGPCLESRDAVAWMHVALMKRAPLMWRWQLRAWLGDATIEALNRGYAHASYRQVWPEGEPVRVHTHRSTQPWLTPSVAFREALTAAPNSPSVEVMFQFSDKHAFGGASEAYSADESDQVRASLSWRYAPGRAIPPLPRAWFDGVATTSTPGGLVGELSGVITLPERPILQGVRRVAELDDAITPVGGPALAAIIKTHAPAIPRLKVMGELAGFTGLDIVRAAASKANGWPSDIAFTPTYSLRYRGIELPLQRPPEIKFSLGCYIGRDHGPVEPDFRLEGWRNDPEWELALRRIAAGEKGAADGWVLVLEGDGWEALRTTTAPKYWAGRIEIPLGTK